MENQTALVIGATGLVGSHLVQLLLKDERFSMVKVFGRRSTGLHHDKLQEYVVDFDQPNQWRHLVTGDVVFSALGTTLKQAGSKRAQYKVDHTYQYEFAQAAAQNNVPVYVLVSAAMASVHSKIFYSRMKGELERDIKGLPFSYIHIIQPGILVGERNENRMGEKLGIRIIRFLNSMGIAKKQKPIAADIVAQAMINVCFAKNQRVSVYSLLEVFKAAQTPNLKS